MWQEGGDMCILLHPYEHVGGRCVGDSGIFYGGLKGAEALEAAGDVASLESFKFFMSYMFYPPGHLEEQV
jgi:hypothetical protein